MGMHFLSIQQVAKASCLRNSSHCWRYRDIKVNTYMKDLLKPSTQTIGVRALYSSDFFCFRSMARNQLEQTPSKSTDKSDSFVASQVQE